MLHATVILADSVIILDETEDNQVMMRLSDSLTGERCQKVITFVEAGAILALAFAGDDLSLIANRELYAVAEPVMVDVPNACRPIP